METITLTKAQKNMMAMEAEKEAAWGRNSGLDMARIETQCRAIRSQSGLRSSVKGRQGSKGRHNHTAIAAGSGIGNPKCERLMRWR